MIHFLGTLKPIFIIFTPLLNLPIEIDQKFIKQHNHRRSERDLPTPPPLLAIAATDLLEHPQQQFLVPFHLLDHLPYFLQMINVKGTTPNSAIESFQTLSTQTLISLIMKHLTVIKCFKTLEFVFIIFLLGLIHCCCTLKYGDEEGSS